MEFTETKQKANFPSTLMDIAIGCKGRLRTLADQGRECKGIKKTTLLTKHLPFSNMNCNRFLREGKFFKIFKISSPGLYFCEKKNRLRVSKFYYTVFSH